MKTATKKAPVFNRTLAMEFAKAITAGNLDHCAKIADSLPDNGRGTYGTVLRSVVLQCAGIAPLRGSIFQMKGNKKLPFVTFSTLPIVTCPGAGECAKFCYSLKAWRNPSAFGRQCINTYLMIHRPQAIAEAFRKLPDDITLRLYVDGDIDSVRTLDFWCRLLRERPDIRAYGYSKSWHEFAVYTAIFGDGAIPANYVLNVSSGSNHSAAMRQRMLAKPFVRGEFVAVPGGVNPRKHLLDNGHTKAMSCPLLCGSCTKIGHACGNMAFKGVSIGINVH